MSDQEATAIAGSLGLDGDQFADQYLQASLSGQEILTRSNSSHQLSRRSKSRKYLHAGWFHNISRFSAVSAEEQHRHSMCVSKGWQMLCVSSQANTGVGTSTCSSCNTQFECLLHYPNQVNPGSTNDSTHTAGCQMNTNII